MGGRTDADRHIAEATELNEPDAEAFFAALHEMREQARIPPQPISIDWDAPMASDASDREKVARYDRLRRELLDQGKLHGSGGDYIKAVHYRPDKHYGEVLIVTVARLYLLGRDGELLVEIRFDPPLTYESIKVLRHHELASKLPQQPAQF